MNNLNKGPGMLVRLQDGRKGIAYHSFQSEVEAGKILIHLVNDDLTPLISDKTGKQAIVTKPEDFVFPTGFID